ncbi:endonuclease exonuclease phosphatase family protein [Cystoisospora suis]|uniref:Endonuclease exonuclease phosphatase family protein n=1 Tax=Cystoisospora suis TaxID=483139 RepID=A0A2C6KVA9_9APIC|nr:endonuclease exonuclease phosphatase family protein [Cystoisospora suis]
MKCVALGQHPACGFLAVSNQCRELVRRSEENSRGTGVYCLPWMAERVYRLYILSFQQSEGKRFSISGNKCKANNAGSSLIYLSIYLICVCLSPQVARIYQLPAVSVARAYGCCPNRLWPCSDHYSLVTDFIKCK